VSTAIQLLVQTKRQLGGWSWFKKTLLTFALLIFGTSSFLYLTPPGLSIREFLAQTVISTQHRDWAWIVVGPEKRDYMVKMSHQFTETSAMEKQDFAMIKHDPVRQARSVEELISEPKDISGQFWKGKMIYVYDPTSIRVVVPSKVGEGERISSMVTRTDAVAGINGGGFIDPDGLGNGFAPIGLILSGFEAIYTDAEPYHAQHIIGFTKEGTLVVGKYSLQELQQMGVKDAVSFLAPRLIANGNPQITTGDGGWGRAPRTAIGQKEDGTLIFVIIDGRQTSSVGATLKEVQDLLLKEGAVNAGLLDGGASSELVVKGELLTKPSSRYGERRLPSGILVYDDPDSYKADRIWDGLNKIDPGGRYDHPDFLKEQAELKNKPPAQTPKVEPEKTQEPAKTQSNNDSPAKTTTTPPKTGGTTGTGDKPAGGAGNGASTGTSGSANTGGSNTGTTGSTNATPPAEPSGGTATPPAGTGTPAAGGASTGASSGATAPGGGAATNGTTPPATKPETGANTGSTNNTTPAGNTGTNGSSGAASGGGSGQPTAPATPPPAAGTGSGGGTTTGAPSPAGTSGSGAAGNTSNSGTPASSGTSTSGTSTSSGTSASSATTVNQSSAVSSGTVGSSGTAATPPATTGTSAPAQ
jgi:exopolysaccharide biosynthesis protein